MTNETILPPFIIADFYKNHLVEVQDDEIEAPLLQITPSAERSIIKGNTISFLGENKKNVTILIKATNSAFINDNELTFLTKILSACNLNIGDIAIVNSSKTNATFTELKEQLKPLQLVLIDVDPKEINLPFTMPEFQVQNFADCTILCSPALSAMLDNSTHSRQLKTKLWAALQKAFNLN